MSDLDLIAAAACDSHCDLLAYGGPYEPDCGCFRRAAQREIRRLRAERDRLRDGIRDLLRHREGDLPRLGYLRDTDESRGALAHLASLLDDNEENE